MSRREIARRTPLCLIGMSLLVCTTARADDDRAEWLVAPYAWLPEVGFEQTPGGGGGGISGSELLEKTDAVGMIRIEAAKSQWGLMLDYIFLDLSDTRVFTTPGTLPLQTSVVAEVDLSVFEIGGVYRPSGDASGIQYLFGYRGINSDTTVLITPQNAATRRFDTDAGLADIFLGARYLHSVGRWDFALRSDYSFGDSDGVLNLLASVGFRFNDLFALQGGYRHAVLDYEATSDQGDRTSTELELSGPFVGLLFRF